MSEEFETEKLKLELEKTKLELERTKIELEKTRLELQNSRKSSERQHDENASDKSRLLATIFSVFLGWLGIHRFYVGRTTSGVLQLVFGWATLFIWNLVDLIMIVSGTFKDKDGKLLKYWEID